MCVYIHIYICVCECMSPVSESGLGSLPKQQPRVECCVHRAWHASHSLLESFGMLHVFCFHTRCMQELLLTFLGGVPPLMDEFQGEFGDWEFKTVSGVEELLVGLTMPFEGSVRMRQVETSTTSKASKAKTSLKEQLCEQHEQVASTITIGKFGESGGDLRQITWADVLLKIV